jgi:hypothetical protein
MDPAPGDPEPGKTLAQAMNSGTLADVAIDPGVTTGWALLHVPADSIFHYKDTLATIELHETGEFDGPETAQVKAICRLLKRRYDSVMSAPALVIEDFEPRKLSKDKDYLAPVRVGAKLAFAVDLGMAGDVATPAWQMPSLAMSTATDERLKAWKLYQPGSEHRKDATRHAITFIRRAKSDRSLRESAWGITESR